jgi:hypothetical protein
MKKVKFGLWIVVVCFWGYAYYYVSNIESNKKNEIIDLENSEEEWINSKETYKEEVVKLDKKVYVQYGFIANSLDINGMIFFGRKRKMCWIS